MAIANVSRVNVSGFPKELETAQAAIHLPEVQKMLRNLSKYNLGIFMPHMHEEQTGQFQPLPDGIVQVEDGLRVTFQRDAEIGDADRYVPIGWVWRKNRAMASAACVKMCKKEDGSSMHTSGHHTS